MAKWKRKSSQDTDLNDIESSYQQYIRGKYKGNSSPKKLITLAFIGSALVVILLVCAALFYYNGWLQDTRINNVSVGSISLKGLTTEEATSVLDAHKDELLPKKDIIIRILEKTLVLTNKDTKAQLDVAAIANAAYLHGRNNTDGDVLLVLDPQDFVNLDASSIRPLLKAFVQPFDGIPVETSVTVQGERPDLTKPPVDGEPNQILTITMGSPKYLCDPEGLFKSILNAHKNRHYEITGETLFVEPAKISAYSIFAKYCVSPINASLDQETFIITEGVYGYGFDKTVVQNFLDTAQWGESITLTLERIKPSITSDDINADLFNDVLASYTAYSSSQSGRDQNLKLACQAINGLILYPGDTFSYNTTLGKRTEEKGYQKANTFYNGEIVESLGGGICQVSSSLYWCAMHADLKIVERVNHSRIVTYMPRGMDATVSWGGPDFRFCNNSDYPIMIEASAKKGNVTVRILGTDYKDYYVKIISKTKKVMAFQEVTKEFPIDNEFGYVNGQVISPGRTGYIFETYRCKYDKTTNKEITSERVLEAVSTHKKADTIIASVPTPEPIEPETTEPETTTPEVIGPETSESTEAESSNI